MTHTPMPFSQALGKGLRQFVHFIIPEYYNNFVHTFRCSLPWPLPPFLRRPWL